MFFKIITISSIVCLSILFVWLYKKVKNQSKEIGRIFILSDFLQQALPRSFFTLLYSKFRDQELLPKTIDEFYECLKSVSIQDYCTRRIELTERIKNTESEAEQSYLNEILLELDNVYNLASIIDENSSEEYKIQILQELQVSMQKICQEIS